MSSALDSNARAAMEPPWDAPVREAAESPLHVDVDGFEGPLDLLLHLARHQRVDLSRISIVALADQYLAFVDRARLVRLELAADYLVMAAWLAYLKSRLLIPQPAKGEEPTGEEMAAQLAFRLKRLEAMRDAATRLVNRNRLGRDVFARGAPDELVVEKRSEFQASLYDLLTAYASQRQRQSVTAVTIASRRVWSLSDARTILTRMIGEMADWTALDAFLLRYLSRPEDRASAMASSFAATLELVREGRLEVRQDVAFAPIYMRRSTPAADAHGADEPSFGKG